MTREKTKDVAAIKPLPPPRTVSPEGTQDGDKTLGHCTHSTCAPEGIQDGENLDTGPSAHQRNDFSVLDSYTEKPTCRKALNS